METTIQKDTPSSNLDNGSEGKLLAIDAEMHKRAAHHQMIARIIFLTIGLVIVFTMFVIWEADSFIATYKVSTSTKYETVKRSNLKQSNDNFEATDSKVEVVNSRDTTKSKSKIHVTKETNMVDSPRTTIIWTDITEYRDGTEDTNNHNQ